MKTLQNPAPAVPGSALPQHIDYLNADFDDIIFQYKNKEYGAYKLRKEYSQKLTKAYLAATMLLLLLVNIPNIAKAVKGDLPDEVIPYVFEPTDYIPEKKLPEPLKIEEPKPEPVKKTLAFVKPKVLVDEKVVDEVPPPDVAELANVEIGPKTLEGDPNGLPAGLTDEPPTDVAAKVQSEEKVPVVEPPFTIVEQMPSFPDGETAMFKFIRDNLNYPAIARDNGVEGTVYVSFVVEKDGNITDITIRRDIGGGCGAEAMRVVGLMPDWLPGKQRGKPVRVQFSLPIKYKLN